MRHQWETREIPPCKIFVCERCTRCDVTRWRYQSGTIRFCPEGVPSQRKGPKCRTEDDKLNKINSLAAILNASLVFMQMAPGAKSIHQSKSPLYEQFRKKGSSRPRGTGLAMRSILHNAPGVPPDRGSLLPGIGDDGLPGADLEAAAGS